jgi:DNA-binding SARP family transcriptional activator
MTLTIQLLGRPRFDRGAETYQFRSRKSWALLTYLLLTGRPPTRSDLAALLFDGTDDPLRALRWCLAEIRRALAGHAVVEGDPVVLRLSTDTTVDVAVVTKGSWEDAVQLPQLGSGLLDGLSVSDAATFESWLLSERRRVAAASEAILHEAAVGSMSRGALREAVGYAVRVVTMSPLDENHHALLIRLYRMVGDDEAAQRQLAICTELFDAELGVRPGRAVAAAMRERRSHPDVLADSASIEAVIEAGSAAVSAGAIETGVDSLHAAVRLADGAPESGLQVTSRLVLASALVHSIGGLDEEGMAELLAANDIALARGDHAAVAEARAELGYVDFLRARYDRAEVWLSEALEFGRHSALVQAKATTYLGSVESDRANYGKALSLLEDGARMSRKVGDIRREAYAVAMLGRIHLLRNDLDTAGAHLDASIELCERDHWLAFIPWPQALRGEVELARGDISRAAAVLDQAFARACQLGDPCWEGMSARGQALVADANGEADRAFDLLADARTRCNRLSDPYVWLDGYILDAQCTVGRRHGHPDLPQWIDMLRELASRTGMRELTVRSLLHGAAIGERGDAAAAAAVLAADIVNPQLDALLAAAV